MGVDYLASKALGIELGLDARITSSVAAAVERALGDKATQLHDTIRVSLPLHELEKLMLDITRSIKRTYIIINTLNECDESRYRRTFLQFMIA
jgi:hypothetical protein